MQMCEKIRGVRVFCSHLRRKSRTYEIGPDATDNGVFCCFSQGHFALFVVQVAGRTQPEVVSLEKSCCTGHSWWCVAKFVGKISTGGSIRAETCERAQSQTYVSPPLSNRFKQRCELVKRSCLANSIHSNKSSRQCEDRASQLKVRRKKQIIQKHGPTADNKSNHGAIERTTAGERADLQLVRKSSANSRQELVLHRA